jgi:hypothetical protein
MTARMEERAERRCRFYDLAPDPEIASVSAETKPFHGRIHPAGALK